MENSMLNEVKAILKSLVLSSTEKITIDRLNRDYRDVEGEIIPFRRLGYGNLEQFLRSIPDTLRVFGSGPTAMVCFVANEKSDHIHDMIMKQRKPKTRSARSKAKGLGRANNNVVAQKGTRFNSSVPVNSSKNTVQQLSAFQSVNRQHTIKTPKVRNLPPLMKKPASAPPPLVKATTFYALPQPSGININPPLQKPFNPILQQQQYEHHVRQITSLLKRQCHIHTKPQSSPPPPLPRQQTRSVKFATETKTSQPTENKHENSKNQIVDLKPTKQLPIKLSQEVEDILLNMPKLRKVTNPITEEFNNANSSVEITKINVTKDIKVPEKEEIKKPTNFFDESVEKVEDPDEAVPSFAAKNNVFLLDFPEHTVSYGTKIPPFQLSEDIIVGSCLKIFISEIHNPFKFWFHIHKENHELDLLMYQIERYYSSLDNDELRIPLVCLTPGQVCAASFNGSWHRAEIVAPPVNTNIKVSFMDYGTVTEVDINNIKFLASYFAQLPAQALRGCLSHIKPNTLHWSHEATTYFLTLVAEYLLYAKITEINKEENILYMILCNTNGDEVVQINKTMVEKHYALYNEDWKQQKINQNNGKRIHHPREDFPTFDMIESGEYPSFKELVNLKQRGIDYETIYDIVLYNQSTILIKHENAPERIKNLPYFLTTSNPFRPEILLELYTTTSKVI